MMSEFLANGFHRLRLTRFGFVVVDVLSSPDTASMTAEDPPRTFTDCSPAIGAGQLLK